jgi:1-acyl-sn-glycerol-3-phosphate acyltransferase
MKRDDRTRKDGPFEQQAPARPARWFLLARWLLKLAALAYTDVEVEGKDNLPDGPALFCFSHQCWIDPMYILAVLPRRPRVYFFGPEQDDMRHGARNRLMRWFGLVVPFAPGARGLLAATQRADELSRDGAAIAIAGEGRIHCGEGVVLPLKDGAAYIALRAGIPLVPVAINGTGWLAFRRSVRIRFGEPICAVPALPGRPRAAETGVLTARAQASLEAMVRDFPDRSKPGPIGRWLTELFNDWPQRRRPPAGVARPD